MLNKSSKGETMKNLTNENIKTGAKVQQINHPEYGTWTVGNDGHFWTARAPQGEVVITSMRIWELV